MKKIVSILIIVILAMTAIAATIAERQDAIVARIKQLPAKKAVLDDKTYSGTFQEIMTQRITDLNDVAAESKQIVADTNTLAVDAKIADPPKSDIVDFVDVYTDANDIKIKERNNTFLKTLDESLFDPCSLPDVNDPNYASTVAENTELLNWVTEIFSTEKELGGL